MPKLTTFDYLLNRMERAAMDENPAKAGYAKARSDVLGYVAAQSKLLEGRAKLLVAYRTGARRTPEAALDAIHDAESMLAAYDASVGHLSRPLVPTESVSNNG